MEDILASIENGQHKQAVRLTAHSNYSLTKVLAEIAEQNGLDSACRFLNICMIEGYIQEITDYEDHYED